MVDVDESKADQVVQPEHQPGDGGVDVDVNGDGGNDNDDADGDVESKAGQIVQPEHQPGGQHDHHRCEDVDDDDDDENYDEEFSYKLVAKINKYKVLNCLSYMYYVILLVLLTFKNVFW